MLVPNSRARYSSTWRRGTCQKKEQTPNVFYFSRQFFFSFCCVGLHRQDDPAMFSKKKKKLDISLPKNFEHRVHTGFDKRENRYVGLPPQWAGIVSPTPGSNAKGAFSARPSPLIDPSEITPTDALDLKVFPPSKVPTPIYLIDLSTDVPSSSSSPSPSITSCLSLPYGMCVCP